MGNLLIALKEMDSYMREMKSIFLKFPTPL